MWASSLALRRVSRPVLWRFVMILNVRVAALPPFGVEERPRGLRRAIVPHIPTESSPIRLLDTYLSWKNSRVPRCEHHDSGKLRAYG